MVKRLSFRAELSPRATIVVVAWRSAPYLIDCLRALQASVKDVTYEVIVVLNEPTPELDRRFGELVNGVASLRTRVNVGFAGAVNLGAAEARGEYLVLLNDDAEVLPGWLEALVESAESRPDLAAVGSTLLFADGTVQEIGAVIWSDGSATNVGRGQPEKSLRYGFERRVDYCSGCSMLVRRSTWLQVGGLDEGYFPAYYEDVDLCFRIQELGKEVWVQPRSQVVHRLSASTDGSYRSFLLEQGRQRLVGQWSHLLKVRESSERHAPFAVDRAVGRAMGEAMAVAVVLDQEMASDDAMTAIERARSAAAAVLECDELRFAAFAGSLASLDGAAFEQSGVELVSGSLAQHLKGAGGPYVLLVVAVPALAYEALAQELRAALSGVPILLDGEVLRADTFVVEQARAAELAAASDADYLVSSNDEIAEMLDWVGDLVSTTGAIRVYGPIASAAQKNGEKEPDSGASPVSPVATKVSAVQVDLGDLTTEELAYVSREIALQHAYALHLERQVVELLDEVSFRDAHVERTEMYAGELKLQIEDLADEIERKNVYIREKEADILRLQAELGARSEHSDLDV
jgi:GT2 family glycosyltransferase